MAQVVVEIIGGRLGALGLPLVERCNGESGSGMADMDLAYRSQNKVLYDSLVWYPYMLMNRLQCSQGHDSCHSILMYP